MELRFLGQAYSKLHQDISTITLKKTACFRGRKYDLRVPVITDHCQTPESQMSAVIYKYRGVSYVVEHHFPTKEKTLVHCQ